MKVVNLYNFLQIADGVKPTLAELEKFEGQPDSLSIEGLSVCLLYNLLCHDVRLSTHFWYAGMQE